MKKLWLLLFLLSMIVVDNAHAQTPNGTIAGVVRDPSGAVVTGAQVKLISLATRFTRTMATSAEGDYSFAALLSGDYEVSTEVEGFRRVVIPVIVEAGVTTKSDSVLSVGDAADDFITVEGASPLLQFDSHTVGGVVTQRQIEGLPLNGRSILDLAKLEPGVQPPVRTNNRLFVPALGQPQG